LDDGTFTGDGCGYVDDPAPPSVTIAGPLVIAGDAWEPDPTSVPNFNLPGVSASLGPLTNLLSPTPTFELDMASIGAGTDYTPFQKDTRGSLVLVGNTCDTDCCLNTEIDLYYGCSEPYCPPETLSLDLGRAFGFLYMKRHCSSGPDCETVLLGGVWRKQ
jgi:hypothetical protein